MPPKYSTNQFAKVRGGWYAIMTLRTHMFGGGTEYYLKGEGREGWIPENKIEEVSNEQSTIQ